MADLDRIDGLLSQLEACMNGTKEGKKEEKKEGEKEKEQEKTEALDFFSGMSEEDLMAVVEALPPEFLANIKKKKDEKNGKKNGNGNGGNGGNGKKEEDMGCHLDAVEEALDTLAEMLGAGGDAGPTMPNSQQAVNVRTNASDVGAGKLGYKPLAPNYPKDKGTTVVSLAKGNGNGESE